MCDPFEVRITRHDRVTLLVVPGELDMATVPVLERSLLEAETAGADPVVVDLRGLDFMDSSGLMMLFRAHERAREAGRRIAVINGGGQAHRLFEITSADQTLEVIEAVEDIAAEVRDAHASRHLPSVSRWWRRQARD